LGNSITRKGSPDMSSGIKQLWYKPSTPLRNPVWKGRAEERGRQPMINARKEGYGAIEVANPDLGGAGIEVEQTFFGDFGGRIGRRKNLDADLWCSLEKGELVDLLLTL